MQSALLYRSKILVVLALLCALAGTGFAHRIAGPEHDPALAAYVQAGGSLADLCADDEAPQRDMANGCESCRLVGAAVLPAHETGAVTEMGGRPVPDVPDDQDHGKSARLDQSRPARAPPAI